MEYKQMNKLSPVTFYLSSSWILKYNMMVAAFMGIKISLWCIKVYMSASVALMRECIKQMLTLEFYFSLVLSNNFSVFLDKVMKTSTVCTQI